MIHSRKGKTARKTERRMCHGDYSGIRTIPTKMMMKIPSFIDDHVPDYTFGGTVYQMTTTYYNCSKGHGTPAHIENIYITGEE